MKNKDLIKLLGFIRGEVTIEEIKPIREKLAREIEQSYCPCCGQIRASK